MTDDVLQACEILQQLKECPALLNEIDEPQTSELALQSRLREKYEPALVRAAMQLHELRSRAVHKFSKSPQMWFHRIGYEQATAELVARHKAARYANVQTVYDLCSGIGMDSIALAGVVPQVISVDTSALTALYTKFNAEAYGVADRIQTRLVDAESIELANQFVHIDPDRRVGKSRAIRLEDYTPSLAYLQQLAMTARGGAIKLSPASNFGGKFPEAEVELISLNGECKEATVWFGELRGEQPWRATILPQGFTIAGDPFFSRAPIKDIGQFIYDPDPALVRAGLIDQFCEEHELARLDDAEEYLTSDDLHDSPAVSSFEVEAVLSNNDKEIRRYFRDADFGEVEIKCRHVPTSADKLRKKLTLKGKQKVTLFIARLQGKTKAVIARRVANQ